MHIHNVAGSQQRKLLERDRLSATDVGKTSDESSQEIQGDVGDLFLSVSLWNSVLHDVVLCSIPLPLVFMKMTMVICLFGNCCGSSPRIAKESQLFNNKSWNHGAVLSKKWHASITLRILDYFLEPTVAY